MKKEKIIQIIRGEEDNIFGLGQSGNLYWFYHSGIWVREDKGKFMTRKEFDKSLETKK
jgi:hypothetical protein